MRWRPRRAVWVVPASLMMAACGRAEFGVDPLDGGAGDAGLVDGGSGPAWTEPFDRYPHDVEGFATAVHPILIGDGCANRGCHDAAEPDDGTGFLLHADAQPGTALMRENVDAVAAVASLEREPADTLLIYKAVSDAASHEDKTPWWQVTDPVGAPYEPVLQWLEAAQTTVTCYEAAFEGWAGSDGGASVDCTPPPVEPCWPGRPGSCEAPDGGSGDGG